MLTSDARKALTRSEKTLKKASRVLDKNLQPIVKQRHIVYRRPVHTSKFIDGTHNRYLKGKGDSTLRSKNSTRGAAPELSSRERELTDLTASLASNRPEKSYEELQAGFKLLQQAA